MIMKKYIYINDLTGQNCTILSDKDWYSPDGRKLLGRDIHVRDEDGKEYVIFPWEITVMLEEETEEEK